MQTSERTLEDKPFSKGYMNKDGNRVVQVPIRTCVVIQKTAEAILEEEASSAILYEMGIYVGRDSASTLIEDWSGDLLKLWDVARSDGFGWFKLEDMKIDDEKRDCYIRISRSFIAEEYGESKKTVCHFLSGFFVGIIGEVLGENLTGEEVKCTAKGDPYCEFRIEKY